jgi:hypothetical protein
VSEQTKRLVDALRKTRDRIGCNCLGLDEECGDCENARLEADELLAAHDAQPDEVAQLRAAEIAYLDTLGDLRAKVAEVEARNRELLKSIETAQECKNEEFARLQRRIIDLTDLVERAFITGAESVDDRISYDYALQRWLSSDMKKDLETGAI